MTALEHAEEIKTVVLQYEDGWAQGDADSIAAVLADDQFVFNEPGSTDLDKDEFMGLMVYFDAETLGNGPGRAPHDHSTS